jgi:hypothetical protein
MPKISNRPIGENSPNLVTFAGIVCMLGRLVWAAEKIPVCHTIPLQKLLVKLETD